MKTVPKKKVPRKSWFRAPTDTGAKHHRNRRTELAEAGLIKIEVYVSQDQKDATREFLNSRGFPTSLSKAAASGRTREMHRERQKFLNEKTTKA